MEKLAFRDFVAALVEEAKKAPGGFEVEVKIGFVRDEEGAEVMVVKGEATLNFTLSKDHGVVRMQPFYTGEELEEL